MKTAVSCAFDALCATWDSVCPGVTLESVETIDSTNTELMRRARGGRCEPVLLVARRQSAGRGRVGRDWASEADAALTFSLGLPLAPRDWSGLSLVVGLAVAQALDPEGAGALRIKWPNDLWREERKLAGILIETATSPGGMAATASAGGSMPGARYAVIGVGINLAAPRAQDLRTAPAWVREWWPQAEGPGVLCAIAPALVQAVRRFEALGFAPFAPAFAARDALRDRDVVLSDGTHGVCAGIGEAGALLVHTSQGMKTIISSELSVRPRAVDSGCAAESESANIAKTGRE